MAHNNGEKPLPVPQAQDDEKGLLGSLIVNPAFVAPLLTRISPDAFLTPAHRSLFELFLEWECPEQPIDFIWAKRRLEEIGKLEEVGGKEGLNEFWSFVPTHLNAAGYIKTVAEKYALRRISQLCDKLGRECLEDRKADPGLILAEAESKLTEISWITTRKSLRGASILDFSQREINHADTLLGKRYLCRGGSLFIVAPSGRGKSTLSIQAATLWACGLPAFGIKPARPLRSLIIQAEDDDGDIIEMSRIVDHLELSLEQRKLVSANTHIEFVNDAIGDAFLALCDDFLTRYKADLLWINPYTAYLGADIMDSGENTRFLRNGLNPILTKHKCAAVVIHHTPKTTFRDTTNWKPSDWMYSGAGPAVLTNWARAYIAIDPAKLDGVYEFIAAKRGARIGWGEPDLVFKTYWSHSRDAKLLWIPATPDEIAAAGQAKAKKTADDLLRIIPVVDPICRETVRSLAKEKLNIGRDRADELLSELTESGKVLVVSIPRPGTNPERKYVRKQ
jgi:DnaB-like helicase N terminal domain/AAA domain